MNENFNDYFKTIPELDFDQIEKTIQRLRDVKESLETAELIVKVIPPEELNFLYPERSHGYNVSEIGSIANSVSTRVQSMEDSLEAHRRWVTLTEKEKDEQRRIFAELATGLKAYATILEYNGDWMTAGSKAKEINNWSEKLIRRSVLVEFYTAALPYDRFWELGWHFDGTVKKNRFPKGAKLSPLVTSMING